MIIYKMIEFRMPFPESDYANAAMKQDPDLVEASISQELLNILMLMLQKNPAMRLTAESIREHPSIKELVGDAPEEFKQDLLLTDPHTEASVS